MEADVAAVCGPRGKHDPGRSAVRHGRERGSVTLGGRRVGVDRPRMRASDGGEVPVAAYELFSRSEILGRMAMGTMLGRLSSRRYPVDAGPTECGATATPCRASIRPRRRRPATSSGSPGRNAGPGSARKAPGTRGYCRGVLRDLSGSRRQSISTQWATGGTPNPSPSQPRAKDTQHTDHFLRGCGFQPSSTVPTHRIPGDART